MSFSAFRLGSDPPVDEPSPKFIVTMPGERPAPKLFVSNDPDDGELNNFTNLTLNLHNQLS